jgi:hypothetical protein
VGVLKLGFLLSQNFGHLYLSQYKSVLMVPYSPWKDLSNGGYHVPIGLHLTLFFKGFMVESQIFNLTATLFIDHNSCKLGLMNNEREI